MSAAPRIKIDTPAGKPPKPKQDGKADAPISLPRRAAPSEHQTPSTPELNDYIKARLPKGEASSVPLLWNPGSSYAMQVGSFTELEKSLGELRSVGDKGHRVLLASVLPRLSQFEALPAALVPQLIQLSSTDDRRLVRYTYYLLQLMLGPGIAGTPSPSLGGGLGVRDFPREVAARAWQGVDSSTTDVPLAEMQLRTLAAAARSADGPLDRELQAALTAVASRADSGGGMGFVPSGKKAAQKAQSETWDLQRVAASISRSSLSGKAARDAALKSFWGISSPQAVGSRHAIALAAAAMRQDAVGVLKQQKTLTETIVTATASYEAAPELSRGLAATPAKGIAALSAVESQLQLRDKWLRVNLARLCAAVVYGDWNSTDKFVRGPGAAYWRLLVLLTTRDVEPLVALESCKAAMGALPAGTADDAARDARARARAWSFVANQPAPEGPGGEVLEGGASLLGVIAARIRSCLSSSSPPLVCGACRAAGAVFEAQARAQGRGSAAAEAIVAARSLADAVASIAAAATHGPGVRCAAIEALLWTQVPGKLPVIAPDDLVACVSSTASGQWTVHVLQPLLTAVAKVLRIVPPAAPSLLAIATAVACGCPCQETAAQLTDLWSAALAQGSAGRSAALDSARSVLNFSLALTPDGASAGIQSQKARLRKAQQDVAWLELAKGAAWWLGEYGNIASGEIVGSQYQRTSRSSGEAAEAPQEIDMQELHGIDALALQVGRNAEMAAVVACLQQAFLTMPWPVRCAASLSLAKIAVRSDEPYRLQCYGFLSSLAAAGPDGAPDTFGVATVVKAPLATLDALYSSHTVLQALTAQYGRMPHKWPPGVLRQLKGRAAFLFAAVERTIGSLQGASYHPLGPLSRDLLASGLDRYAEQPTKPPEMLESPFAAPSAEAAAAVATAAAAEVAPISPTQSLAATQSVAAPNSPLFSEASIDPLSQLVKGLDNRIQTDMFPKRAPRPWETSFVREPSMHQQQPSFDGSFDTNLSPRDPYHSRNASMDNVHYVQGRGIVQHPFEGQSLEELSVSRGEEVEVEAEVDGWLHCISLAGAKGLVPATYVRMLAPGENPPTPQSPPQRGHSRQASYDFFSQDDPLAAFTKPEAPPAWTTFEGYDDRNMFASQPSVEVLGEEQEQEDYAAPQYYEEAEPAREEDDYVHVDAEEAGLEAGEAVSDLDSSRDMSASQQEDRTKVVSRVPSLQNWASGSQPATADSAAPDSSGADERSRNSEAALDVSPATSQRTSLPESDLARQVSHGGLLHSVRRMSPHSRTPSIDAGGPPSPSSRASRHSRASSFDSAALAGIAPKPRAATVLHQFDGETEDELSVAPGEELVVLSEIEGWLQVHRPGEPDKVGFIPSSYASELDEA